MTAHADPADMRVARLAAGPPAGALRAPRDLAAWNRALNRTHSMSAWRARAGWLVRLIEARRRLLVARRVLRGAHRTVVDVGAEDGWMCEAWSHEVARLTLVDVDAVPLSAARDRLGPSVTTVVADATDHAALAAAAAPGTADVVVLSALLEHLPDPHRALEGCARLLRPGGRLVVFVPADGPILFLKAVLKRLRLGALVRGVSLDPAPGHLRQFDRRALAALLARHGEVAEVTFDPVVLGYVGVARRMPSPTRRRRG